MTDYFVNKILKVKGTLLDWTNLHLEQSLSIIKMPKSKNKYLNFL